MVNVNHPVTMYFSFVLLTTFMCMSKISGKINVKPF